MSKIGAKELRQMFDDVGLKNTSGHYMSPDLQKDLDGKIAFAKQMGQEYIIVTVPWISNMSRVKAAPAGGQMASFLALLGAFTLDDYKMERRPIQQNRRTREENRYETRLS